MMESLLSAGVELGIIFYNPNIFPEREYRLRKDENRLFAEKLGVPFIDADYDPERWMERVKGFESEPERGRRCTLCFDVRMERTALYAHEHDYPVFITSAGISRWKDMNQVNQAGFRAAARYPGLAYWDHNWRKGDRAAQMVEIAKEEHFYQQEYCGCQFSLEASNRWREARNRPSIVLGEKYYGLGPNAPFVD